MLDQSLDLIRLNCLTKLDFSAIRAHEVVIAPEGHGHVVFNEELGAKLLGILNVQLKFEELRCVADDIPIEFLL